MSRPDPFDLVPRNPQPEQPGASSPQPGPQGNPPTGRNWGWLIALVVVAFLFFSIGAALFTLRDRLGSDEVATPAVQVSTATVPAAAPTGTPGPVTATPSPSPTATALPTASPTPTPCPLAPASEFEAAWRQEVFGCAMASPQVVWSAWEPFERGAMFWRSDVNRSFVLSSAGAWQEIAAGWDGQGVPGRGDPPEGRVAPERGFGWVWSTDDAVFNTLGWGTDIERGFCAQIQEFEQGVFVTSTPAPSCTADNLYNQAAATEWQPVLIAMHESGVWSGSLGGRSVIAPAPTRVIEVSTRPEGNGVFTARGGAAIQIDGQTGDWPADNWSTIAAPVEGAADYSGPQDVSAVFQTAWTTQGLLLVVQALDDRFRPGALGTDLWKGDAIEIQFDTRLAEDFNDSAANEDDYQLGIALLPDGKSLQSYRWLPFDKEGVLPAIGVGSLTSTGSVFETLIPWGYFGLDAPQVGDSFGFNVSLSDNDGDATVQQTIVSASPFRTTFDNPTEWATLAILP